ncbi:MAG: putative ABC transport system permease protein [Spirochaetes bacterium]|nr:MAG: putative ABC transport system permease protein [Spirochaetota bacterium]
MFEGILIEGLVYGILALGVFISFRVLDFPDLTVEGSFPAGAAAAAILATRWGAQGGSTPGLAISVILLVLGFLAGAAAGLATSAIHHRLKVPPLLAGIVTMTGFYSINLRILGGKPNLPLIKFNPLLQGARDWLGGAIGSELSLLFAALILAAVVVGLLDLFFHTEIGIGMGALGVNEAAVVQAGVNPISLRRGGIMLANGLAGLSGALAASYQGFADVNFGAGIVAAGLASVMIGELLLKTQFIGVQLLRVLLGSILFRGLMYAARSWGYLAGIGPNDLRLLTALLIIGAMAISGRPLRGKKAQMPRKTRGSA